MGQDAMTVREKFFHLAAPADDDNFLPVGES